MKLLIYYIIPLLVLAATFLGRFYYFILLLDAYAWIYNSDIPVSFKVIFDTTIHILSILLVLIYLLYMRRKHKRGHVYSFIKKVSVVVAIAFFIEIAINGLLMLTSGAIAVLYGLSYMFTVPLALFVSYFWIVINAETTIEERE